MDSGSHFEDMVAQRVHGGNVVRHLEFIYAQAIYASAQWLGILTHRRSDVAAVDSKRKEAGMMHRGTNWPTRLFLLA